MNKYPPRAKSLLPAVMALGFLLAGLRLPAVSPGPLPEAREEEGDRLPPHPDLLEMRNGDMLRGQFIDMTKGGQCRWNRNDISDTMVFPIDQIAKIHLGAESDEPETHPAAWRIYLANADVWEGRRLALTNQRLEFESPNAGPLSIPRAWLRVLLPLDEGKPPLFVGFREPEKWTFGEVTAQGIQSSVWKYRNDAFYAFQAASLARDIELPPEARIRLHLAWKDTLSLAIGLYTDSLQPINLPNKEQEPPFCTFYSLALVSQGAVLRAINQTEPIRLLGQTILPDLDRKPSLRVEILVSKSQNAIQLVLDGRLVKTWIDEKGFAGEGTGIRFVHQGRGSVRISNFEVRPWNGQLQPQPDLNTPPNNDLLLLRNNQALRGEVTRLDHQQITLQRGVQQQSFPIEQIRMIQLRRQEPEPPADQSPIARVEFHNTDRITLLWQSGDRSRLTGFAPGVGPVSFSTAPVETLTLMSPQPTQSPAANNP